MKMEPPDTRKSDLWVLDLGFWDTSGSLGSALKPIKSNEELKEITIKINET